MDFDEQLELDHFVLTERKCRVCGKIKDFKILGQISKKSVAKKMDFNSWKAMFN